MCMYLQICSRSLFCPYRLLHLAIIHEAKDYMKAMIDQSKNTDFLNIQNDLRQVQFSKECIVIYPPSTTVSTIINVNKKVWDLVTYVSHLPMFPLQTPLHLAVITNQAEVCQHLLQSGCDPTLVDNRGDTPLHIACRHGNLLCFSVITQNCQKEHLRTMMAACNYNGKNIVGEVSFISRSLFLFRSQFRHSELLLLLPASKLYVRQPECLSLAVTGSIIRILHSVVVDIFPLW